MSNYNYFINFKLFMVSSLENCSQNEKIPKEDVEGSSDGKLFLEILTWQCFDMRSPLV